MNTLLRRVFDTSAYNTPVNLARAQTVYSMQALLLIIYSVFVFFLPTWVVDDVTITTLEKIIRFPLDPTSLSSLSFYIISIASLLLARRGVIGIAAWGTILAWFFAVIMLTVLGIPDLYATATTCSLFIFIAGLLQQRNGIIVTLVISLILLIFTFFFGPFTPYNVEIDDIVIMELLILATSGIAFLFLRMGAALEVESTQAGAMTATEGRLKLADLTTQISRSVTLRRPQEEVLNEFIQLILQNYPDIYHAQIFLTDERQRNAKLVASTGEVGRQLIAKGHQLAVGSSSVIGQVTLNGKEVVARADAQDSVHLHNELLSETRVEAAFPLQVGDKIIGALDIQSRQDLDMDKDDRDAFQSLANNFALAIDNLQQFERAEDRNRENQRLTEQARNALRQVERLNERLIGRAWADYLSSSKQASGLNIDFLTNQIDHDNHWTALLSKALEENNTIESEQADKRLIAIPLRVHGQTIGAMEFELDKERTVSAADYELLQEISERFGLAAENTRLLHESQRGAQREAVVNTISARLQGSNNVQATLTEAARSLQETLRARRVAIRLHTANGNTH